MRAPSRRARPSAQDFPASRSAAAAENELRRPRRLFRPADERYRSPGRSRGFVFEAGVEILVLGDDLLKQRPVDGVAGGFLLDVAHFDQRVGAVEDELGLAARVDDGGL